jgi:hypothetical protein
MVRAFDRRGYAYHRARQTKFEHKIGAMQSGWMGDESAACVGGRPDGVGRRGTRFGWPVRGGKDFIRHGGNKHRAREKSDEGLCVRSNGLAGWCVEETREKSGFRQRAGGSLTSGDGRKGSCQLPVKEAVSNQ